MNSLILLMTRNLNNQIRQSARFLTTTNDSKPPTTKKVAKKTKGKTPKGKFDDEYDDAPKSYNEKEPLEPYPKGVNPKTGEQGGPRGPEPTR
jgi:hypothetical protein